MDFRPARVCSAFLLVSAIACGEQRAHASVNYEAGDRVPVRFLSVTLKSGGWGRSFIGGDFVTGVPSVDMDTPTSGSLSVAYEMRHGATPISAGSVVMDLRRDWIWGVDILIDSVNPGQMCFGCTGTKSFPLAASYQHGPSDSVWVLWGGNSISHPVVY